MESVKIDFIQHPLYSRYAAVNDKDTDNKIYDTLKKKFLKEYTYDNGKVRVSIKINDYKFILYEKGQFIYECFTKSSIQNVRTIKHINNNNSDNRFINLELNKSTRKIYYVSKKGTLENKINNLEKQIEELKKKLEG